MDFWLNQALGLLGSLIVFISVQFNNRRVILAAQAIACLMWIVHYGLLGAMTAATINILSFARSVVFYFNDRKWAKSRAWLWAFLALYVVNTVLTWDGPRSLLPGIAMSMTTIALWTRDMRRTRLLYLTNSPFWFTYDILARSYSCMVIEAIAFVSYVVAVWRFDIKKQPQARSRVPKSVLARAQTRPTALGSRLKGLQLAASHELCTVGAQLARLRAEMYFLRRTRRRRK